MTPQARRTLAVAVFGVVSLAASPLLLAQMPASRPTSQPAIGPATTQTSVQTRLRSAALAKRVAAKLEQDGNANAAVQAYQKIHELDPTYATPLLKIGIIAQETGRPDIAARYYQDYLQLDDASDYAVEAIVRLSQVREAMAEAQAVQRDALAYRDLMSKPARPEAAYPTRPQQVWSNSIGVKMTYIPAGDFVMGTPLAPAEVQARYGGNAGWATGETAHRVKISKPFLMSSCVITQEQWVAVMGKNPSLTSRQKDAKTRPVEMISWEDAQLFCVRLSLKEGRKYRLPTEAEWEYACRAGTTTEFYFGDKAADLAANAWYQDNSDDVVHPVGQLKPNAWGLFDMSGNVWQWCGDAFAPYPSGDAIDPKGPAEGMSRVLRGGCAKFGVMHCRSSFRMYENQATVGEIYGLRLVMELE